MKSKTLLVPQHLSWVVLMVLVAGASARAQDGHIGRGHDHWHDGFYQRLMRPGTNISCCNLKDCRPTQIRANGDHYEIMKDGRWLRVDPAKIVKITAPDGGAHICAPDSSTHGDEIYCVVMPMEG